MHDYLWAEYNYYYAVLSLESEELERLREAW